MQAKLDKLQSIYPCISRFQIYYASKLGTIQHIID